MLKKVFVAILVLLIGSQLASNLVDAEPVSVTPFLTIHQESVVDGQFDNPLDLTLDKNGNLYVLDSGNDRVQVFDTDGNFLSKFDWNGTSTKDLDQPIRIEVDDKDRVYILENISRQVHVFDNVKKHLFSLGNDNSIIPNDMAVDNHSGSIFLADSRNHQIHIFDNNGNYQFSFGGEGSGDGQFKGNFSLTVHDQRIFTLEGSNHRIQVFDINGKFLFNFGVGASGNGQFNFPFTFTVDSQGRIYVAILERLQIQVFTENGDYLSSFIDPELEKIPHLVNFVVDKTGKIYLSSQHFNQIRIYENDSHVFDIGDPHFFDGLLITPNDVAVDSTGTIYVTDYNEHKIKVFSNAGDYVFTIENTNEDRDFFIAPREILIDDKNRILVHTNNGIHKFDTEGTSLAYFSMARLQSSENFQISDMALDKNGDLFILDANNNRVNKYDENGNVISSFILDRSQIREIDRPLVLAIDEEGMIFVGFHYNPQIQVYDKEGKYLFSFGNIRPGDIEIDSNGFLYISDYNDNRILVFDDNQNYLLSLGKNFFEGQFSNPGGIGLDKNNRIFVIDTEKNQIQGFDLKDFLESSFLKSKEKGTSTPTITPIKTEKAISISSNLVGPYRIEIDDVGHIYVISKGYQIQKFSKDGNLLDNHEKTRSSDNMGSDLQQSWFSDLSLNKNDQVFALDRNNNRIQVFGKNLEELFSFGEPFIMDKSPAYFSGALHVDLEGRAYIAENSKNSIDVINPKNELLFSFNINNQSEKDNSKISDIKMDSSSKIYAVDQYQKKIHVFEQDGTPLFNFNTYTIYDEILFDPLKIAIDSQDRIYLVEQLNSNHNNPNVKVFDNKGEHLFTFDGTGLDEKTTATISDIAIDNRENLIYIADNRNHKIRMFSISEKSPSSLNYDINYQKHSACKDGFELIFKTTNHSSACVKPSTAKILIKRGWGILE